MNLTTDEISQLLSLCLQHQIVNRVDTPTNRLCRQLTHAAMQKLNDELDSRAKAHAAIEYVDPLDDTARMRWHRDVEAKA